MVEDDAAIRSGLVDLFGAEGYDAVAVANGLEALTHLRETPVPDAIVLDLMMPIMDGWQFRVEQRKDPALALIPVVAMSADSSAKAAAIGVDAYVKKPLDFQKLLDQIERVIEQSKRKRSANSDRMAALGTLAAGIAHEINNPLTLVLTNLQLIKELATASGVSTHSELEEIVEETLEGAHRIREIVKAAQSVAPLQPDQGHPVADLRAVIDAALREVNDQIRNCARLVTVFEGSPRVAAAAERLTQVLVNLLLNATEALPAGDGENQQIRVSLRDGPAGKATIEISDTGAGIPAELHERIFQPFFTTRTTGQGRGLGLSICHAIVTAAGGELGFESKVGEGSTFRLTLPTTSEAVSTLRPAALAGGGVSARPDNSSATPVIRTG